MAVLDGTQDAIVALRREGGLVGEEVLSLETIRTALGRGGSLARGRMLDSGCVSEGDIPDLKRLLRVEGGDRE